MRREWKIDSILMSKRASTFNIELDNTPIGKRCVDMNAVLM